MFVCKSRYCRFLTNIESSPVLTVLDINSAYRYSYLYPLARHLQLAAELGKHHRFPIV